MTQMTPLHAHKEKSDPQNEDCVLCTEYLYKLSIFFITQTLKNMLSCPYNLVRTLDLQESQ